MPQTDPLIPENPDTDYENAAFIPDAASYPPRWAAAAAEFRAALGERAETGIAYGDGARQVFDLFRPEGRPRGLFVFIHGGYWRAFAPSDWSHLAAGALGRGWAVAMPGYTLAPAARIAAITGEVARAITEAAHRIDGPIVVSGHSAGGHLSARMICADVALPVVGRVARIVPISPLADLRPLLHVPINDDLRLDGPEALAESPRLHAPRAGVDIVTVVGGAERPAFLQQARWLHDAWGGRLVVAPDRHHFDVIDGLADPGHPLTALALDGL